MRSKTSWEVSTGTEEYEEIIGGGKGSGDLDLIEDSKPWDIQGGARKKKAGDGRCTDFSTQGLGCLP